ncbi:MAG: hypothetical protein MRZ59_05950 [Clostridiales bacterium]|nr:hypothetical protein [Clostridiales bacterium]MDY3747490.1 hypothetical protein [Lachnospiraceae bacterium]
MKKGSKRFFALFLAAAMAVTPLSYANAEGEDGSQLTDMSEESEAKKNEPAVSYENVNEPEKVQETKETEREVKESEQEVKETGQESKETEQEVKETEQESKETEQETKETEKEVKETEPEAKETVKETSESGTEEQKSTTPSEIVKEAEQLLDQNSENEIELLFVNIGDQTYEDGKYDIAIESSYGMFKIAKSTAEVKGEKIIVTIETSSATYDRIYIGSKDDADKTPVITGKVNDLGGYTFVVELSADKMGKNITFVPCKKDTEDGWYVKKDVYFTVPEVMTKTDTSSEGKDPSEDDGSSEEDKQTIAKDGEYADVSVESNSSMFKIVRCVLKSKAGKMTAVITLSGTGYDKLYMGTAADAAKADASEVITYMEDADSNYTFTVPVTSLDQPIAVAAHSVKKDVWYDSTLTFKSDNIDIKDNEGTDKEPDGEDSKDEDNKEPENPEEIGKLSDGDYKINVESSASMFKVTKCILSLKDGKMSAIITLSGTGYDYLYMGTADEAVAAADSAKIPFVTDSDGKYTYAVPVSALDTPIAVAAHSIKNDQWYDRMLTFKSAGMTKIESGENEGSGDDYKEPDNKGPENTGDDNKSENDNKEDSESKYESDTSGSTGKVDSSTALKDGVYTPDKFSWSGGTGKVSISCSKVTIKNGQAYATIVFSSSSYGYVKASGNTYYPTRNGDTSVFTIPVALNKNNRIIGMTTKMSANHEIEYSIYVYLAAADQGSNNAAGDLGSKDALDEEAPAIAGLDFVEEEKIEYAKYFKIYHYENDITLLEIDMRKDTGLNEDKDDDSEDEDESLYDGNVVKYLVVPEDEEIPAGLDKEVIVVRTPVENAYVASEEVLRMLDKADSLGKVASVGFELKDVTDENIKKILQDENLIYAGTFDDIDYKKLLESQCKIAVMPYDLLPKEDADEETIKECREVFEDLTQRLELLEIPVIVDRSESEKEDLAKAEWIKIYGTLFGFEKEAADLFDEAVNEANN